MNNDMNKELHSVFIDRLTELLKGGSARKFAISAGINETTFRAILNGSLPRLDTLVSIAKAGGVSLSWLIGETDKETNIYQAVADDSPSYGVDRLGDFEQVNLYEVQASAGHGAAVITDSFKLLYFRKEWFNSRGLTAKNLLAVNVVGDSMEPDIPDESVVLVDTTQKEIKNGAVYVFTHNDDLLIKRMMATITGYKAKSINPLYDDMEFDKQTAQTLNVVGRAVRALPDIKL